MTEIYVEKARIAAKWWADKLREYAAGGAEEFDAEKNEPRARGMFDRARELCAMRPSQIDSFEAHLSTAVADALAAEDPIDRAASWGGVELRVDYDPYPLLQASLHFAGVRQLDMRYCGVPHKTRMVVRAAGIAMQQGVYPDYREWAL